MGLTATLQLARAVTTGVTQPRRRYRHIHLSDAPLLITTTLLAGEPAACLAIAARRRDEQAQTWVIPEPRDRDLRDAGLAAFHRWLLNEVDRDQRDGRTTQLIVPTSAEADGLARLGRLHRYQRTGADRYPDDAVTGAQLLTVLTGRRDLPGSALCLDASTELQRIWVPPMSAPECAHLGALVAAIDPPDGMHAQHAAVAAEHTSMGLVPDPHLDNDVLLPALERFNTARTGTIDVAATQRHADRLTDIGQRLVAPKLGALTHAVQLLMQVPETPSAAVRFHGTGGYDHAVPVDAVEFARQYDRIRSGTARFARRLPAHLQASHLARAEAIQQIMDARELDEDPLAFAEAVADGRAWTGRIVDRDDEHRTIPPGGRRRVVRPLVTARSHWPMLFPAGSQLRLADPEVAVTLEIVDVDNDDTDTTVVLQVVAGMRRWKDASVVRELRITDTSSAPPPRPPDVDPARWQARADA